MQEIKVIKVNNSTEFANKIKELMLADKELKICGWYNQSQTVFYEPNGEKKVIKEARSGARMGRNYNPNIDVYFETKNHDFFHDDLVAKVRNELEDEFQNSLPPFRQNSNYQPPQAPQDRQESSPPTPYQPELKDKKPNQNNDDNKDIINLINKYFQENQASSIELSENKKILITYKQDGPTRWSTKVTPIVGSRLQKIKDYLEKNNKNSISKQELTSLNKISQPSKKTPIFYYLTWILGILLIIVSGLTIRFWLLLKTRKNKK